MTKHILNTSNIANFKSYCRFSFYRHLRSLKKKTTSVNFWFRLLCDSFCILVAYLLAYSLRFEAFLIHERQLYYAGSLILIFGIKLPVFYFMGLYNGMWRYTSLRDLQNIIKAVLLSSFIIVSIMLLVNRFRGFSRAVFIMDAIICLLFLLGNRICVRFLLQHSRSRKQQRSTPKKRLLLIGAGNAAEKVVREIGDNSNLPYELVGIVDDDTVKSGMHIHGIPILGTTEELREIADQVRAEKLLITIVDIDATSMKRIVDLCQQTKLPFKILPGLDKLIEGKLSVSVMRDITYSDLLGRAEVKLDQDQIGGYVTGKHILVTGAGGSIGSELCRQLLRFHPGLLILFDAGEENLYAVQMNLEYEHSFKNYVTILGKVQNRQLLNSIFDRYKPDVVFHAAAYKHVPLLEINPWEAIFNNVFAAQTLMETAILHKTKRFVLVSTDKAVRPTNVMGASKRLTELLLIANSEKCKQKENRLSVTADHNMACMAVRFGNVLGSSGSVIPLFRQQIEHGGPVTVTHPEITRYFMSIEEAAQLILQAGAMGGNGEIFLLKMGPPIKIDDLARDLIKLMGHEPETDIKIAYTGLRPGEKIYEELITEGEDIVLTNHEKIMVLRGECPIFNEMQSLFNDLFIMGKLHDSKGVKEVLQKIIPEYVPDYISQAVVSANSQQAVESLN